LAVIERSQPFEPVSGFFRLVLRVRASTACRLAASTRSHCKRADLLAIARKSAGECRSDLSVALMVF